jgi:hypothetical protein
MSRLIYVPVNLYIEKRIILSFVEGVTLSKRKLY